MFKRTLSMSRKQHPRTIGLITPYLGGEFSSTVIAGAYRQVRRHGARLIVVQESPEVVHCLRLAQNLVQGWLIISQVAGAEQIAATGVPVVTICGKAPGLPMVLPDNHNGMYAAVEHLIAHGHRRIGFIGRLANPDVVQRFEGYQAALAAHDIPFDERLLVDVEDEMEPSGVAGAQALLASGQQFSALVFAGDLNALGALPALRAAGRRVPEDVAIVSFDDIEAAQTATPPLTTTHQSYEMLAIMAVDRLMAQIADPSRAADITYTPTALVIRRSCGCQQDRALPLVDTEAILGASDWCAALTQQLVHIVAYPFAPDLTTAPAKIWPGLETLVMTLERAIAGGELPSEAAIEQAWREVITLTANLDLLNAAANLIEEVAARRIGGAPRQAAAHLTRALQRIRGELVRAMMAHDAEYLRQLDAILYANNEVSLAMLNEHVSSAPDLKWLQHIAASWGCLGLWVDPAQPTELVLASVYVPGGEVSAKVGSRIAPAAFPPLVYEALDPSDQAEPQIVTLVRLRTAKRDWGVLAISSLINTRVTWNSDPFAMWMRMLGAVLDRAALLANLNQEQEERRAQQAVLQAAYERERMLSSTVREIGCPVIPLAHGVLLIPLIGAIDAERTDQIIKVGLDAVSHKQTSDVIIDVTGVPVVDTHVAGALIRMARMVSLLGARTILVGVRPEIAQSMVSLGIDLSQLVASSSVAEAIRLAVQPAYT
jgi:DNA-binding LacI/PurR family transcriptional regulator